MNKLIQYCFVACCFFYSANVHSQNVMLNAVTHHSGIVKLNETVFFEIKVSNTSPVIAIPAYKIKIQINFPESLVNVPDTGHVLPDGWKILSNKNGVVLLSNGTDIIAENENRNLLIAIQGKAVGGPSSIKANLFFANGIEPGVTAGSSLKGDNTADNSSSSSIEVRR